eukprot:TRINITY_DN1241_c0_g2_i1.p1 TRINITY_DN1241_c0_g2~~TRINITY_DN1241_c0_g2_i1.p1  ORF type:complete len:933 (-),score=267.52 TRINITY_DN1241_c0_g2_i1:149-2803(-)
MAVETEASSVLLPTHFKPRKYELLLEPDLETFKFRGFVKIYGDVLRDATEIKLHAEHLKITKVEVHQAGGALKLATEEEAEAVEYDKDTATAAIRLHAQEGVLRPGPATVSIEYTGIHNDNMTGFYRAWYQKANGSKVWIATTQFEPIGARQALPCFDEPAVKATFEVSIRVPGGLMALSNMPVVSTTTNQDGSLLVQFAESPIMSTYLLAFVVGAFECLSTTTPAGTQVNVWTVPGKKDQGKFSLEVAAKVLSFFAEYFGIAYPLPKADLIAIPDFAAGAMENWGLITFRENLLLLDDNAPAASKQRVAYVISHELAHQWFGNLVTMKWWTDLWLNEGFATWVGWLGVDSQFPDWDVWTQFVSSDLSAALETDALLGSHPVEVPINDPKEIEQLFDTLSYRKGASVIRQLEAAIGADVFKEGLRQYLAAHTYGNTVTNDLWAALEKASGKPVKTMMDSWTRQVGYPLVTITLGDDGSMKLRQNRFLSKGLPTAEEDSNLWVVPITGISGSPGSSTPSQLPTSVLAEREGAVKELSVPAGGWFKLNLGQTGIYRVNYPPVFWGRLAEAVKRGAIPTSDRLGLLMDAFALAKSGILPTSNALQLVSAYREETEFTVWTQISSDLGDVRRLLLGTPALEQLDAVGRYLLQKIGSSLGWEAKPGESHLVAMLRPLVLRELADFGDKATIAEAQKHFQLLCADPQSVNADLRRLIMATAVKNGGKDEYEAVKKLFFSAPTHDFKIQCLVALASAKQEDIIKEFLQFLTQEENVKAGDVIYGMLVLGSAAESRDVQWEFLKENWEAILRRYKATPPLMQRVVTLPIKGYASEEKAEEFEEFFAANPVPEASMELKRTLEGIVSAGKWAKRDYDDISSWLSKTVAELPAV